MTPTPSSLSLATALSVLVLGIFLYECLTLGRLTRRLLRFPLVFFALMETAAIRVVQQVIRPRFVLQGECHECGDCCRSILGVPPRFIRKTRLMGLYLYYHRVAHRFTPREIGEEGEIIFECGHLQSDGRCGIYWFRPLLCRNYPIVPFYHAPSLLPGCSYQIAPRVVAQMTPHPRLPILNRQVAIHHPTAPHKGAPRVEDFQLIDESCSHKKTVPGGNDSLFQASVN